MVRCAFAAHGDGEGPNGGAPEMQAQSLVDPEVGSRYQLRMAVAVQERQSATKAAGVVSLAVMLSRVLGLLRDLLFAALFGAGRNMDAFIIAFRAPNLLRDLFAEGALSTAFVTTFSRKIATEGDRSAWRLAGKMDTLSLVFMRLSSLAGVLFD